MVYFRKLANFQKLTIWKTNKIPKNFNSQNSQKFSVQKIPKIFQILQFRKSSDFH